MAHRLRAVIDLAILQETRNAQIRARGDVAGVRKARQRVRNQVEDLPAVDGRQRRRACVTQ